MYATNSMMSHYIHEMTDEQDKHLDDNPDDPIDNLVAIKKIEFNDLEIEKIIKNTFIYVQYQQKYNFQYVEVNKTLSQSVTASVFNKPEDSKTCYKYHRQFYAFEMANFNPEEGLVGEKHNLN